jgi:hypothetical protein
MLFWDYTMANIENIRLTRITDSAPVQNIEKNSEWLCIGEGNL